MKQPLISIIGATGTGKSKAAVDLALALGGEVVNADAMQMYRGLPIVTNKITEEERRGVPHHMLNLLDTQGVSHVGSFVSQATDIIQDIHRRGRVPILVGGTHFYVQSLLFPHLGVGEHRNDQLTDDTLPAVSGSSLAEQHPVLDAETRVMYETLKSVDPVIASRWHPNDRRHIRRSLEIYYSTGCTKTASEIYASQRVNSSPTGNISFSKYRNLLFWVHSETEVLRSRLDARVDTMLGNGMMREINDMENLYQSLGGKEHVDITNGIWQSIGFKEFLNYLQLRKSNQASEEDLEREYTTAVSKMKTATRQYARVQVRWIRVKLLNALRQANKEAAERAYTNPHHIYLLNSSDPARYGQEVAEQATNIANDFLNNRPLPDPFGLSALAQQNLVPKKDYDFSQRPDLWVQKSCEFCGTITVNESDWEKHLQTTKHKKRVSGAQRWKQVQKFLEQRRLEGRKEQLAEQEKNMSTRGK